MDYREAYKKWLEDPYFDEKTKEELSGLEGSEIVLSDGRRFDIRTVAQVLPEVDLEKDLENEPAAEIDQ